MPYLLPRGLTSKGQLALILAFGDLSYLEARTVLPERLSSSTRPWEDIALLQVKDGGGYESLAGVHKVAVSIAPSLRARLDDIKELDEFLGWFEDGLSFSVSFYSPEPTGKEEYEEVLAIFLKAVRDAGLRKANLVRPRNGTEVLSREISSRRIVDFVVIRVGEKFWVGATAFVPDVQQFQVRSNERPVVSSQISIPSRLARLLLNLSGAKKGDVLLDPFCGSGTILSEALVSGVSCIGVDWDRDRIENSRQNLEWLSKKTKSPVQYSLKVGDSTRLEKVLGDVRVDAIVTEPILLPRIDAAPTESRAKKLIRNSSRLYSEALYSMAAVVRKGGRVVIVTPSLRTLGGEEVSVLLENEREAGLRQYQPAHGRQEYPVRIAHESTRWVGRLVYVFERV